MARPQSAELFEVHPIPVIGELQRVADHLAVQALIKGSKSGNTGLDDHAVTRISEFVDQDPNRGANARTHRRREPIADRNPCRLAIHCQRSMVSGLAS